MPKIRKNNNLSFSGIPLRRPSNIRIPKKEITQQQVIKNIKKSNKKYEEKFITEEEREARKNRGPPVVVPEDFEH